jgi:hypothetical protein
LNDAVGFGFGAFSLIEMESMNAIWIMALLISLAPAALAPNSVTGLVRNGSRGQPAVGDEVVLIRLGQQTQDEEMQVESRAKTDAQGAFSLPMLYSGRPYLVRVIHQSVAYDRQVSGTGALSIEVFDASSNVPGITGTVEILRAGMRGKLLHVSDMYEIVNLSSPPTTQAGERTFEVYMPANAKLDLVLAAGPEKIAVMISATPIPGEPGHYSVNFPLRPGATKFAFNYDLPYSGQEDFPTRHAYALQQLAVIIPSGMRFSSPSPDFETIATGDSRYQVRAVSLVKAGEGPRFELSGAAVLPLVRQRTSKPVKPQASALPNSSESSPDRAIAVPLRGQRSPLAQPRSSRRALIWKAALGISIILAACSLVVWRRRKENASARRTTARFGAQLDISSLEGLKDAFLQLETSRLGGSISAADYATARQALKKNLTGLIDSNSGSAPADGCCGGGQVDDVRLKHTQDQDCGVGLTFESKAT